MSVKRVFGMWDSMKAASRVVAARLDGKIRVGSDAHGNTYWVVRAPCPSTGRSERRSIDYKDGFFSSETIPQLWYRWLYHLRDDPPTDHELHTEEKKQAAYQALVRHVEAEDEKKRIAFRNKLDLDVNAFVSQVKQQQRTHHPGFQSVQNQPHSSATDANADATADATATAAAQQPATVRHPLPTSSDAAASAANANANANTAASRHKAGTPTPAAGADGTLPSGQGDSFQAGLWTPKPRTKAPEPKATSTAPTS